jgi:hypothetical protein
MQPRRGSTSQSKVHALEVRRFQPADPGPPMLVSHGRLALVAAIPAVRLLSADSRIQTDPPRQCLMVSGRAHASVQSRRRRHGSAGHP